MEPIVFDNRLIVFTLLDNFVRISPLTIFQEYITKLKEEGKTNITIFNLSERFDYITNEVFSLPVCEFGWPERQAPSLEKLCSLCKAIDSWLNIDDRNIAVIYSKKDLSRSSLAIAVFLVYIDICYKETAFDYESMSFYYRKHLETYLQASQKRYVNYFRSLLSGERKINNQQFFLNNLVIRNIPNFNGNGYCKPFIKIYQNLHLIYCSQVLDVDLDYVQQNDFISFQLSPSLKLRGDILIKCYHYTGHGLERNVMFSFQFHTSTMVEDKIAFTKENLDIAPADKRFHPETVVELFFNNMKLLSQPNRMVNISDGQLIDKSNSYENFMIEENMNNNEVEYTKGPLDGSLYATIPKRLAQANDSKPAVSEQDVTILDQILNDIFYEIQAFPEVVLDKENISQKDGSNLVETSQTNNVSRKEVALQKEEKIINDVADSSEQNHLTWLQKQQLKLKIKQDKNDKVLIKRSIAEKKLFEELKQTMRFQRSSSPNDSLDDIKVNGSSQSFEPKVPIRKSSKLLLESLVVSGHNNLMKKNETSSNEDFFDGPMIQTPTEVNNLVVRSSTPSFPVPNFRLSFSQEENTTTSFFIKDTSSYWYKPHISREEAVRLLRNQPTGTFIIRDSNSFQGAFGLAVKVADGANDPKAAANTETELDHTDLVRHFLIESTTKGVQIKGCPEEPVFSSLAALVYQHSLTRISLPTKLIIPTNDLDDNSSELMKIYENGAVCNVLYFTSEDVESLTGPTAIQKVIDNLFESNSSHIRPIPVHFKASTKGVTLTDNSHRLFFRQHYPLNALSYFMADPKHRTFLYRKDNIKIQSEIFGFVAKKKGSNVENQCLIFGHYEMDQPSHAIIDFVNKLLSL